MMEKNAVALVTNASDFAGIPAVDALVKAGFRVIAHDRGFVGDNPELPFAASSTDLQIIAADKPEDCIAEAFAIYGRLDVIVSNDHHPARKLATEALPLDEMRISLERLVVDPFALVGAAISLLKEQGGNIVMITSNRTKLPMEGSAIPDAARGAANAMVKALAVELAPYGISINAIAPNFLYSEAYYPRAVFVESPLGQQFVKDSVPLGRLGEPEEMGELIAFLAQAQARFLTGAIIDFSGGWPMSLPRPEA